MRVLVTGICGLTGRFLYRELKTQCSDNKYVFFVRDSSDVSFMEQGEELFRGELTSVQDICQALKNVDMVIHLASIYLSENITRACEKMSIKRVFYVHTTGMFSKHKKYSAEYIGFENIVKKSSMVYTIIRPTMIYGNDQDVNLKKLIQLVNRLPIFPVIGKGHGLLHPIYARDLAKSIALAFKNEEITRMREYNVAGKAPVRYIDLLKIMARELNKKPIFVHIPMFLAKLAGRIGDLIPNGLIGYEKVLRIEEDKNFDYSAATKDFGFNPISIEEGIKLEVQALRESKFIN